MKETTPELIRRKTRLRVPAFRHRIRLYEGAIDVIPDLTGKIIKVPHRKGFWRVISHKADASEVIHLSDGVTFRAPRDHAVVYHWPEREFEGYTEHTQEELPRRRKPGRPKLYPETTEKTRRYQVMLTDSEADAFAEYLGQGSVTRALRHIVTHVYKSINQQQKPKEK